MKSPTRKHAALSDAQEIARQFKVELDLLVNIESALQMVLQWRTGKHGIRRKLSTLRFVSRTFESHLSRLHVNSEHGGYMHLVTDTKPNLVNEVSKLRGMREALQTELRQLIISLDLLSSNELPEFERVCEDFQSYLKALSAHDQQERDLFLRSVYEEEGGCG